MEYVLAVASTLAARFPLLLVKGIAFVLALLELERRRTTALLVMSAVVLGTVTELVSTTLTIVVPFHGREVGWTSAQLGAFFSTTSVISSPFQAISYALLIAAIFGRRAVVEGAEKPSLEG